MAGYEQVKETWFSKEATAANEGMWLSSERMPPLPLPAIETTLVDMLDGLEGDTAAFVAQLPNRWVAEERAFLELVSTRRFEREWHRRDDRVPSRVESQI